MIDLVCAERQLARTVTRNSAKGWEATATNVRASRYENRRTRLRLYIPRHVLHNLRQGWPWLLMDKNYALILQPLKNPSMLALPYLLINVAKGLIKHEHKLKLIE
jgi:hypothetical protein